ncbi:unnamed protein product [Heterobilharzia americana]|nr:unnamed protein product [Heterobilharzia americana]
MWIVCCRKQESKGKRSTDKSKHHKQKYLRGQTSDENADRDDEVNEDHNHKVQNDPVVPTKLRSDSHDSNGNGCYPRQERRSLPDVVIPSTHLARSSLNNLSNHRPSLQIDYETGRRPTIMVETTAKLAESESLCLDDQFSSSLLCKTFLVNDVKTDIEHRGSVLGKRRAHSLIPTYCGKYLPEASKARQARKSEVMRGVDDGKKLPLKKRLSLLKVKPLKRFRKSKESIISLDSQKSHTEDDKANMLLTTSDLRTDCKPKSSFKRIKNSKLFSPAKSSRENIITSKDNSHESCSERSEDSLGQLPFSRNSVLMHINARSPDAYTDPRKRNLLDTFEHSPNSRNTVLRPIVTPFAQILASLRKVRTNFILLTNVTSTRDSRFGAVQPIQSIEDGNNSSHSGAGGQAKVTASETLEELEWCLERLENIQTHRSVSDMASSKFKKMLNKELSQFADGGQSGKQISEYICSTFLDSKENDSLTSPPSLVTNIPHSNTHGVMCSSLSRDGIYSNNYKSETNTCSPSSVMNKSDSCGTHAIRSSDTGHVVTTVSALSNIVNKTTNDSTTVVCSITTIGESSTITSTTTIVSKIGSIPMIKSFTPFYSSTLTSSVTPQSISMNMNENNNTCDGVCDGGNKEGGSKTAQSGNFDGSNSSTIVTPSPCASVHHNHPHHPLNDSDKNTSLSNTQTQIVPYIMNSTNPDRLEELLQNSLDQWGIDIFEVDRLTTNPLTCIFYNIVQKRNLLQQFAIPERNLILYMNAVEEKYNDNPYHNRIHAADVVQSTHILLNAQSLESVFTDLEIFTVLFACAIHDVGHPGVTNQYLINTNDKLAILYNDSSVLENHHLAIAFSLLGQPGHDVFENFPRKQRLSSRRMIIDMVLATDMSKHMSLLADLKTMVETKKVAGSSILTLENYIDRMQILQNMVHCADLSNPAKPLDLYRQWTNRVMEELFRQGDKERELGIDISPICDRNTATVEKSQVT